MSGWVMGPSQNVLHSPNGLYIHAKEVVKHQLRLYSMRSYSQNMPPMANTVSPTKYSGEVEWSLNGDAACGRSGGQGNVRARAGRAG